MDRPTEPEKSHAAIPDNIADPVSMYSREQQRTARSDDHGNISPTEHFDMDADDEDSTTAPIPSKGKSVALDHTALLLTSEKSKAANQPGHQIAFPTFSYMLPKPGNVRERTLLSDKMMLHDVTNLNYGGAVDSQSQQVGNLNRTGQRHDIIPENDVSTAHGQGEQETQFSMLNDSAPPATYESMPLATGTNKSRADVTEYGEFDLPILNVSSLVHLDNIMEHANADPRSGPTANSVDLLAVIFEVGESKEIPVKTFARGAAGQAHLTHTTRLCSLTICQPHRDGQGGIAMMEVSLWGKLAERTDSAKYRFVKGDIVWFKSE